MQRLVVGITGASGVIYGSRLLEVLRDYRDLETHLVLSKPAERTIVEETGYRVQDVKAMASVVHPVTDIGASIASGSFQTMGMVVIPCSIHTVSAIAYCLTDNLVTRAADVVLKEGRKLVLVVRETPLSEVHLENMLKLSRMGVTMLPPMPAFYNHPQSIDDMVNHIVGRVLDQFGIPAPFEKRWDGHMHTAAKIVPVPPVAGAAKSGT